jgi:two-component system, NtrC family, response regulator HydG
MRASLVIEAGEGEPRVFPLSPDRTVTVGRHRNNLIVLHDEHASRWHAELFQEDGRWFIRDFGALNGTRVNGEPIVRQAPLENGHTIGIGKTSLRFTLDAGTDGLPTTPELQSLVAAEEPPPRPSELDQTVLRKDELTALCQFMAASVRQTDPRALILLALETVHSQTGATVTGFLSLDQDDPLPKMVLPKLARVDIHLSRQLTQQVQKEGRAVWLGSHPCRPNASESLLAFTDAICVPLHAGDTPLGAMHVYLSGKPFTEREKRFCEVLVGHLANSLHLLRVHRNLKAENSRLRIHSPVADQLIGNSPAMHKLRQRIARLAVHSSTVLILGESGVGKELVAQALHHQSPRRHGPLVGVNCAAIAPTLLESELFGHCKGAFSGAVGDHPGLFQQADEGTLFLDEVGELSLECQAKLLRVIEGKGFRRVGGTADIQVDVRTIAATHRDLQALVQAGRFRPDLFFRLQGLQIHVPPLREHIEDIGDLVHYFLKKLAVEWDRQVHLTPAALERLQEYSWPGNVRQLRSVLENAVALSETDAIEPADLVLASGPSSAEPPSLDLEELESWAVRQALRRTGGNISQAARMLGIVRDTLASKMKKYGIKREES